MSCQGSSGIGPRSELTDGHARALVIGVAGLLRSVLPAVSEDE